MGGCLCQGKAAPRWRGRDRDRIALDPIQSMFDLALPTLAMMAVATAFLVLERIAPGRALPHARGWYGRAILINLVQVAITFATNSLWLNLLSGVSLFHLAKLESALLQLAGRHIRFLLVASRALSSGLLGCLSPGAPFAGTHRSDDRLLQTPGGDPDR